MSIALIGAICLVGPTFPATAGEGDCEPVASVSDTDGTLDRPFLSRSDFKRWVQGMIPGSLQYTFPLGRPIARPCIFSEKGWADFSRTVGVDESRKQADRSQAVLDGVLDEPPVINAQGVNADGAYEWRVSLVVRPWFETAKDRYPGEPRKVRVVVSQVGTPSSGKGLIVTGTW